MNKQAEKVFDSRGRVHRISEVTKGSVQKGSRSRSFAPSASLISVVVGGGGGRSQSDTRARNIGGTTTTTTEKHSIVSNERRVTRLLPPSLQKWSERET